MLLWTFAPKRPLRWAKMLVHSLERRTAVPSLPAPAARRLTAPSWRDARLVVGVVLVLAATVLGSVVVAAADDRVPVYAARGPLVPGEPLDPARLVRVDVQLGEAAGAYLAADAPPPTGQYVVRAVPDGELVPRSALGGEDVAGVQPLTLRVDATSAAVLVRGSLVDVYANPLVAGGRAGEYAGPERVLAGVSVALPASQAPRFGGPAATVPVQVMVPAKEVRTLIALVDEDAKVTLVPRPGSPLRSAS